MSEPASETCMRCGRTKADATALEALSWVREAREGAGGGERWLCDRCARDHVRDIEGKLPHEYW
ncbi:MAG: hypothetical protein ACRDQB_05035 [Thermocrispum sp.]